MDQAQTALFPQVMEATEAISVFSTATISPENFTFRTMTPSPRDNAPDESSVAQFDSGKWVEVYKKISPGLVSIRVLTLNGQTIGSGFVFDDEGHILTSYHVVESTNEIEVSFLSGNRARAKLVGFDPDSDIAVLKVEAPFSEIHPLPLGNSDLIEVGQHVAAFGNPFGLEGTMTTGIISGLERSVQTFRDSLGTSKLVLGDFIQTDAAINPGNSGGPLVDLAGHVIGVNEIIQSDEYEQNRGIGFALSINVVIQIANSIIEEGVYTYPYLGISSLEEFGIFEIDGLGLSRTDGIYVTEVFPDSPAEKAGLKAGTQVSRIPGVYAGGDLIIAVDGIPVQRFDQLMVYLIKNRKPGDQVLLRVFRNGEEIELKLILGERETQELIDI